MVAIYSALLIVATVILQTTLADYLTVVGVRPDLMLLLVVWLGLTARTHTAIEIGFVGGLAIDVFSGGKLGMNAFCMSLLAFLVAKTKEKFVVEHPVTQTMLTFICSLAYVLTSFILQAIAGFELPWKGALLTKTALFAMYNSLVCSLVLYLAGLLGWQLPKLLRV